MLILFLPVGYIFQDTSVRYSRCPLKASRTTMKYFVNILTQLLNLLLFHGVHKRSIFFTYPALESLHIGGPLNIAPPV